MKRYFSGSWAVIKNYLFAMIFFFIFFIGFYSKIIYFSVVIFIILLLFIYNELVHLVGVEKRRYGNVKFYDGAIHAVIAIAPFIIIQIILYNLNLSFKLVNFSVLKISLIKALVAPMLFIAKLANYSLIGYILSWSTIVIIAFLGYLAGYKGFDLDAFIRRLVGLQPRKPKPTNKNRR